MQFQFDSKQFTMRCDLNYYATLRAKCVAWGIPNALPDPERHFRQLYDDHGPVARDIHPYEIGFTVPVTDDLKTFAANWAQEERDRDAELDALWEKAKAEHLAAQAGHRYVTTLSDTVVDTLRNETVCECFDSEDAERIAAALNAGADR